MKTMIGLTALQLFRTLLLIGCGVRISQSTCPAEQKEEWSYRGYNGPTRWGDKYPLCNGKEQSPIHISTGRAVRDNNLKKLRLVNYDVPLTKADLENNGHTVHIKPTDDVKRTIMIGNPEKEYTLQQFHFHWGSEHTLNRRRYDLELHLVHRSEDSQIAVVGVIYKEDSNSNFEMQTIIESLKNIKFKGSKFELKDASLILERLLSENPTSYYRYKGSLTTPECNQNVIWTVTKKVVVVGREQMAEFRKLKSISSEDDSDPKNKYCALVNNYRPAQPLNRRIVYSSV